MRQRNFLKRLGAKLGLAPNWMHTAAKDMASFTASLTDAMSTSMVGGMMQSFDPFPTYGGFRHSEHPMIGHLNLERSVFEAPLAPPPSLGLALEGEETPIPPEVHRIAPGGFQRHHQSAHTFIQALPPPPPPLPPSLATEENTSTLPPPPPPLDQAEAAALESQLASLSSAMSQAMAAAALIPSLMDDDSFAAELPAPLVPCGEEDDGVAPMAMSSTTTTTTTTTTATTSTPNTGSAIPPPPPLPPSGIITRKRGNTEGAQKNQRPQKRHKSLSPPPCDENDAPPSRNVVGSGMSIMDQIKSELSSKAKSLKSVSGNRSPGGTPTSSRARADSEPITQTDVIAHALRRKFASIRSFGFSDSDSDSDGDEEEDDDTLVFSHSMVVQSTTTSSPLGTRNA